MRLAKMSDSKLEYFRKKARGRSKTAHVYGHMLMCYETLVENACDPNADTIEWKPEVKEAIDNYPIAKAENKSLRQMRSDVWNKLTDDQPDNCPNYYRDEEDEDCPEKEPCAVCDAMDIITANREEVKP